MASNRVIGAAIGIMMQKYLLTNAQAFQLMVTASQHTNRKLRDLADRVVETGALPVPDARADELLATLPPPDGSADRRSARTPRPRRVVARAAHGGR